MAWRVFLRASRTPEQECSDKEVDCGGGADAGAHAVAGRGDSNSNGSEASTEPTERVDEARGGAATLDADDIVEAGEDVGVVKALEVAEANHRDDEPCDRDGPSGEKEEWDAAEKAERLGEDAASAGLSAEPVGE